MIFVGDGALLQDAIKTALNKGYKINCVYGNTNYIAKFCHQHNILFKLAADLNKDPTELSSHCTDGIVFSINNSLIFQPSIIELPNISLFGIHSGIIPIQRGNPIVAAIFAILNNHPEYGVSLFKLNAQIDGGNIIATYQFPIQQDTRLQDIVMTSTLLCHQLFEEQLDNIMQGKHCVKRISLRDTNPYSLNDLNALEKYIGHSNFDRATDFGNLDNLLSDYWMNQVITQRNLSQSARKTTLLSPREKQKVIYEWNAIQGNYDRNLCIHQLIEQQAEKTPHACAVINVDGTAINYLDINSRANQLANFLIKMGIKKETSVGICLTRSSDMIIGLLAILKAGATFIPIDFTYPKERISFILEDATISLLLTQVDIASKLSFNRKKCIYLDDPEQRQFLQSLSNKNINCPVSITDLAYLIYTSGSTGKPKGVMVEHRAVYNTFAATQAAYPMRTSDRFLSLASFGSDTAIWQLLAPLCWGASVLLNRASADPIDIIHCIDTYGATIVELVPSLLRAVLETADTGPYILTSLQQIISSGEALTATLLHHAAKTLPHCAVFNQYGPTETASQVTYHRCYPEAPISIGKPIAHNRIYILDSTGNPVAIGSVGEIVIGGAGVARGYLNQENLTKEKFTSDPFAIEPNGRMYKTGDLGRFLSNGEIEFLGRVDHQIKIRGHRIELGEIEQALQQFSGINDAIVTVDNQLPDHPRLAAFALINAKITLNFDALRTHLQHQLPLHMIPAIVIPLSKWPLTPHGKVDRNALPPLNVGQSLRNSSHMQPRNAIETKLLAIWSDILGITELSIDDHFFDVGGHSLLAIRLIAAIRTAFGIELSLSAIFEMPHLTEMAAFIADIDKRAYCPASPTEQQLRNDAKLPDDIQGPRSTTLAIDGNLLLTGATGFLGRHLLHALIRQTNAHIYCLIRASDQFSANQKLSTALQSIDIDSRRVTAIAGNLSLPDLGIASDMQHLLTESVTDIYHSGALVNHMAPYARLFGPNVNGTLSILRLAARGCKKIVHFVSSIDVVTGDTEASLNEELLCHALPRNPGGYTLSKWVADQLVAQANTRGVPVCIYRTGYIGPHSITGDANSTGWFELLLQTILKLKAAPSEMPEIGLTPVDVIATSIASLSKQPTSVGHAFHLLHRQRVLTLNMIQETFKQLGYQLTILPIQEWRQSLRTYCAEHPNDPAILLGHYLDSVIGQTMRHNDQGSIDFNRAASARIETPHVDINALLPLYIRTTRQRSQSHINAVS